MTVTPVYAALLALLYVFLSLRVIGVRRSDKVSLGDGGSEELQRRIRVHGNFAEYVPIGLILMTLAEMQSRSIYALHAIGLCLVAGRVLHALGVTGRQATPRVVGMVLTFTALIIGALANLGLTPLSAWLAG